ncbi:MAG: hypothetical protein GY938_32030 [Ketobacter sp.]|nr:hypothetical protein [Ketobacter sp.]
MKKRRRKTGRVKVKPTRQNIRRGGYLQGKINLGLTIKDEQTKAEGVFIAISSNAAQVLIVNYDFTEQQAKQFIQATLSSAEENSRVVFDNNGIIDRMTVITAVSIVQVLTTDYGFTEHDAQIVAQAAATEATQAFNESHLLKVRDNRGLLH